MENPKETPPEAQKENVIPLHQSKFQVCEEAQQVLDQAGELRFQNLKLFAKIGLDPLRIMAKMNLFLEAKIEAYANTPKQKHGDMDFQTFNQNLITFLNHDAAESRKLNQLLTEDIKKKAIKDSLKI